jgi:hypothetical protein
VQRHLHLGRARPQRAPAGFDQRHQKRRPPRRPRCLPDQGQGGRAFAARAGAEEGDREEDAEGGVCEEGGLRRVRFKLAVESFGWPGRKTRLFLFLTPNPFRLT